MKYNELIQLKKDLKIAGKIAKNSVGYSNRDRPELEWIKLTFSKGNLMIEATDTLRLFKKKYKEYGSDTKKNKVAFIHCNLINEYVDRDFDEKYLKAKTEMKYPDTSIIKIPKKMDLSVKKGDLLPVIEAFRKLDDPIIEFRAKPKGKLTIFNKILKARLEADIRKYHHFTLNATLLIDLIQSGYNGTDLIGFGVNGGEKPINVNGSAIMPVRLEPK